MFKLKLNKKNLAYPAVFTVLLILLVSLVPVIRTPLLDTLKNPLILVTLIEKEIGGIIFYHRNMVQCERLTKEADLLRQKLYAANEFYLENKRLKKILSFKEKSAYRLIAARAIGHSADNWSSVVIIDKGTYHGIKRGLVVITYLGLVGRVIETTEYTSKVMLINDPNLSVSAIVQRSRQEGLVSGTLSNSLIMRYLPLESDIKVADVVLTSGLTEMYPKGLVIGTVVSIGEEFSGLSRYAVIKPAVSLSNIEEVLVIIP